MTTLDEVLTEVAVVEMAEAEALLAEVVAAVVVGVMPGQTITTSLLMTRAWAMMDQVTRVAVGRESSQWTTKFHGLRSHVYVVLIEEYNS
jgi:uncharacterized membrane protein